jgi:hypothetical protein
MFKISDTRLEELVRDQILRGYTTSDEVVGALRELIDLRKRCANMVPRVEWPTVRHLNEMKEPWELPIVCTDEEYHQAHLDIRSKEIDIIEYRKILYGKRWREAHGV